MPAGVCVCAARCTECVAEFVALAPERDGPRKGCISCHSSASSDRSACRVKTPKHAGGGHDVRIFDTLPEGEFIDETKSPPPRPPDAKPVPFYKGLKELQVRKGWGETDRDRQGRGGGGKERRREREGAAGAAAAAM